MSEYKIPEEYYFRIHHVRPRFKGDIENVLIYVAEELTRVGEKPTDEFVNLVNDALYQYPGNAHRELKTINNWRTEISALFGFIEHTDTTDKPGRRAIELANNQDLVESFKIFLYNFQYPGAHIKPKNVLEQIEAGVRFKPAQYILQLLRFANKDGGNSVGITKFEACHCIFNDLRVTRDNEGVEATWKRINDNRKNKMEYDQTGDVVRYAGDIIDYMEIVKQYDYILRPYESYSLDWVGSHAVNAHKIEYEGTLQDLYEKDPEWYYFYNAIDSCIGELIHYKLKSLESPCAVSSITLVPLQAAFGQVALGTANVFEEFYEQGKKVIPNDDVKSKVPYEGALPQGGPF